MDWEFITACIFAGSMLLGIFLFANWLIETRFGSKGLIGAAIKRNDVELHIPFVFMFIWLAVSSLGGLVISNLDKSESMVMYIFRLGVSIAFSIIGLLYVKRHFTRGLSGFGLNFRTFFKDLWWAIVNLLTVRPLIFFGLFAVSIIGKLFVGEDFQLEKHQSLETIAANDNVIKLWIMISLITVITPVFEELLFRGIIQSTINSYLSRPWCSIFITSAIFASLHSPHHFLAVFALSSCMGYAYQKSGSLIRAILIHSLFNTANTLTVLLISF